MEREKRAVSNDMLWVVKLWSCETTLYWQILFLWGQPGKPKIDMIIFFHCPVHIFVASVSLGVNSTPGCFNCIKHTRIYQALSCLNTSAIMYEHAHAQLYYCVEIALMKWLQPPCSPVTWPKQSEVMQHLAMVSNKLFLFYFPHILILSNSIWSSF